MNPKLGDFLAGSGEFRFLSGFKAKIYKRAS